MRYLKTSLFQCLFSVKCTQEKVVEPCAFILFWYVPFCLLDYCVPKTRRGWLLFYGSASGDAFKWSRWIRRERKTRVRRRERNGEGQVSFDCCGDGISIQRPSGPSRRPFGWWKSTEIFYVLPSFFRGYISSYIPLSTGLGCIQA